MWQTEYFYYLCVMRRTYLIIFIVAGILFLPWLGETLFNTKGEPREAIVAVSMLQSGDWVLPTTYGGDLPYKPPFLAWLIAIFATLFNGGEVNEYISRLPSALAAIGLLTAGWYWAVGRIGRRKAWLMLIITATSFEFFRAATACRVDMVLTACMVGGMYAIYAMRKHPWRGAVTAIVLLSGATLAKGPVGSLLPCLAMGIFLLLDGKNFFRTFFVLLAICLASSILPGMWYYAAYLRGGDDFLALALEENVGRLTGTMGYQSHVNPWWYNLVTIVAGMLPWTVPVIFAFAMRQTRTAIARLRRVGSEPLMAWTVGLVVLVFYCIPDSKRSVYLLPMYPFMAYGCTWVLHLLRNSRYLLVWFRIFLGIAIVAPVCLLAAQFVPGLAGVLQPMPWWRWGFALLPTVMAALWLYTRKSTSHPLAGLCLMIYVLLLSFNAAFAPMILNPKSDRPAAMKVNTNVPANAKIYGIVEGDSLLRYYTINFYLGDRLLRAPRWQDVPAGAYVLAPSAPQPPATAACAHNLSVVDTLTARSCDTRAPIILFRARSDARSE